MEPQNSPSELRSQKNWNEAYLAQHGEQQFFSSPSDLEVAAYFLLTFGFVACSLCKALSFGGGGRAAHWSLISWLELRDRNFFEKNTCDKN